MTPAEQHAAVLAAIDDLIETRKFAAETYADDIAGLQGRRRILERHEPDLDRGHGIGCSWCEIAAWPCADYRDAAAGLLPEETP